MIKTLTYHIVLAYIAIVFCMVMPGIAQAAPTSCPVALDPETYRDSNSFLDKQKYWFALKCAENHRGVEPSDLGPYQVESLELEPEKWEKAPVYIPVGPNGVACIQGGDGDPTDMSSYTSAGANDIKSCEGVTRENFWVELQYDISRQDKTVNCALDECKENFVEHLSAGDTYYHVHTDTLFRAERENEYLCVYALRSGVIEEFIDCRKMPVPIEDAEPPTIACWVAASCTSYGAIEHQWMAPITSLVTQCVTETMNGIFVHGRNACPPGSPTAFQAVQTAMKDTIFLVLMLFIITLGYKVALGQMHNKTEMIMTLIKVALVMYFAVGEGWQTYFTGLTGAANDLARIVFTAAFADYNYCIFPHPNANPYAEGYSWMALWDSIDCKMYYYFGFRRGGYPHLIMIMLANLFGFAFFSVFLMVTFMILFFKFIIYAVRAYLIAIIAIAILVYISPIFITCALFEKTKGYYKKWQDELIGYVLYPMVLFASISVLVAAFDRVYWGDAQIYDFNPNNGYIVVDCGGPNVYHQGSIVTAGGKSNTHFSPRGSVLSGPAGSGSPAEVESAGCVLEGAGMRWVNIPYVGIRWPVILDFESNAVVLSILKACLFAYIFAHFMKHVDKLVQAITGTFRTAGGAMPNAPDKEDFKSAASTGAVAGIGLVGQVAMLSAGGGGGAEGAAGGAGGGAGAGAGAGGGAAGGGGATFSSGGGGTPNPGGGAGSTSPGGGSSPTNTNAGSTGQGQGRGQGMQIGDSQQAGQQQQSSQKQGDSQQKQQRPDQNQQDDKNKKQEKKDDKKERKDEEKKRKGKKDEDKENEEQDPIKMGSGTESQEKDDDNDSDDGSMGMFDGGNDESNV